MVRELATYQHMAERIALGWHPFREKRRERLRQQERHGVAAERVAENIIEDLFTTVLDWSLGDVNNQVGYADIELTRLGIKYLIIEAKRPGALAWNRHAVDAALAQARRYADEQRVRSIAVSDGVMLYAADLVGGGLRDRLFVSLEDETPPLALWWLSTQGIYRSPEEQDPVLWRPLVEPAVPPTAGAGDLAGGLLHPKYKLPAHCFAHVGHASDPGTWHLPYRLADGSVDARRLPKAIQAILTNYRGATVTSVPEADIPAALRRLADAASSIGKMPGQAPQTAPAYQQLASVLEQLSPSA